MDVEEHFEPGSGRWEKVPTGCRSFWDLSSGLTQLNEDHVLLQRLFPILKCPTMLYNNLSNPIYGTPYNICSLLILWKGEFRRFQIEMKIWRGLLAAGGANLAAELFFFDRMEMKIWKRLKLLLYGGISSPYLFTMKCANRNFLLDGNEDMKRFAGGGVVCKFAAEWWYFLTIFIVSR